MACFKCGISEDRALMYDVISPEGVLKVCKKCSQDVDMPIIRKPTEVTLKESREKSSVRDVLVKMSGYKDEPEKRPEILEQQEAALHEVVKKNLPEIIKATPIPTDQFVDHFHWLIMRYRRKKKLTQKELAHEIREPEAAVKLAEQGIVSMQTPHLIDKLEKYLDIKLRKDSGDALMGGIKQNVQEELFPVKKSVEILDKEYASESPKMNLSFDPVKAREVTIGDLKSMKEEKEERLIRKEEKPLDEQDLSDKEVDDILFGRK